ncbi:MAG TPA: NADPH-dependent F420 reductase [Burkholderiales bacterium]|nr:NADPH-dependent F420 reductase [Burkholderiales bacterium]
MSKPDTVKGSRREFLFALGSAAALLAARPLPTQAAVAPLKIATIGSGHIGSTLGSLWAQAGHPVMFSSRHPEELKDLVAGLGPLAHAGTVEEAIAFGDAVLLAVPYRALPQLGKDHAAALAAKVLVLDACNPIPARDGEIAAWAREKGAGLASAELLPGARLVRAFNAIGYAKLPQAAHRQGERIGMPMAGDDANAIAVASRLVREIGFEPVLVGPLAMGKYLIPGTPLAGEHTPQEIRRIVASLN